MTKASLARNACLVAMLALFASCTTGEQSVNLGNNAKGYKIACGGWPWSSDDDCTSEAQSMCGASGYTVVEDDHPYSNYSHAAWSWNHETQELVVRCNQGYQIHNGNPTNY